MSRNQLKSFPTAVLRRGMVHFHPSSPPPGSIFAGARESDLAAAPPIEPAPAVVEPSVSPGAAVCA